MRKLSLRKILFFVLCCSLIISCTTFKKGSQVKIYPVTPVEKDILIKSSKPKSFYEALTKQATVDRGFCAVYKLENRFYFEIPDSVLNKDILVVNRIAKAAAQVKPDNNYAGYGADQIGENVIQFYKGGANKIFIKKIDYSSSRSIDTGVNGLYKAVQKSNLAPIMASFDIKGYSPDSSSVLVDLTDYITTDNELFFFSGQQKRVYNLGYIQNDKSYVQDVNSFPQNIEIKTVKTFTNNNPGMSPALPYLTYELNTSIVLLPEILMKTRLVDERVGYFGRGYVDFDIPHPQGFNGTWLVTRWRLEPKEEDIEKYLEGELVEPKKPIVYYIDPATPKKWVPYLIAGVKAWQKAFEKAGFKNAINALEAPSNDPEWSLEDTRHSAIVYKASWVQNASGPNVNDPRTGEILEAHINWYHNITELLHDWYFVQASPNDTAARKMILDDSLMGRLITYVCTHEVGHTLGLAHNFASSSTVPVDSLRSKAWVEANGICPSIMDYARFNYVAQPEDCMEQQDLVPKIGAYDEWAIEWGYRWHPAFKTSEEEKSYLNKWVVERLNNNPALLYTYGGVQTQAEDLGDDAVKAGMYGIQNLKRVMPQILNWTKLPGENYDAANKMERQVVYQFRRYLNHVTESIGGRFETPKTIEQKGSVLEYVSKEKQKAAVDFLQQEIFKTPTWLFNKEKYAITGGAGYIGILNLQKDILNEMLSPQIINRLIYCQAMQPAKAYTTSQYLNDLEKGIFAELQAKKTVVDLYRRNLQKTYIAQLLNLQNTIGVSPAAMYTSDLSLIDLLSVLKAHKAALLQKITAAIPTIKDEETKWHLTDIADRLKNTNDSNLPAANAPVRSNVSLRDFLNDMPGVDKMQAKGMNCWQQEEEY